MIGGVKMKVFVTGACGQLGSDVVNVFTDAGHNVIASDIKENVFNYSQYVKLDITDANAVYRVLFEQSPDLVIHCAAWTNVDAAELQDNTAAVDAVNITGTNNVVAACKKYKCKLVFISTDYVFNGSGTKPYTSDSKDLNPLNYYGKTKLLGEKTVSDNLSDFYIVRTSWLFGKNGNNFVNTMLKLSKTRTDIKVVNDQFGTPTYSVDLANFLLELAGSDRYGYYNVSNEGGYISWYEYACAIFQTAKIQANVLPVSTEEYGLSIAARPKNSRFDKSKLVLSGFTLLPDWKDSLKKYIDELYIGG